MKKMEDEQDGALCLSTPGNCPERIYTVNDVIDEMGFGAFQLSITVFCGMLWLTDSMEFMILSMLSPAVKCQWGLSSFEEAMITSFVFFGFFLGGLLWGVVFDIIGRKRGLFIINIFILIFGLLSALKVSPTDAKTPGYQWLLVCRFGVGFGASGVGQSVTYYIEFLPQKTRGICVVLANVWWAMGSMLGAVLAIGVMGEGGLGWHWYLGLAAVPLGLVLFAYPFVPESARFYLVQGKPDKAQEVLKRVAWMNCKEMPLGRVVSQEEKDRVADVEDVVLYSKETVTVLDNSSLTHDDSGEDANAVHSDGLDLGIEKAPLLEFQVVKMKVLEALL